MELERVVASPSSARPSPALWPPGSLAAEQNSSERGMGQPGGGGHPPHAVPPPLPPASREAESRSRGGGKQQRPAPLSA